MRPSPARPRPSGFTGYVSEHRFRLIMLARALVLALMLVVVYATMGFARPGPA